MTYELYYWDGIQGRGEFVRLALEEAGSDYIDVTREPDRGTDAMMAIIKSEAEAHIPFAPPFLKDGAQIAEELRDETGETVQLSVLDDDMMMVLLKEEGIRPLRIISNVGSRVPVNWAAAGRLLVSDMDDKALTALLTATVRPSPTGRAATDVAKLITQIRRFRRQGYATELNETNEHAGCVAAPVIDASGRCIAALSVAAPEQRLAKPNRDYLIVSVIKAAEKLSRRLG